MSALDLNLTKKHCRIDGDFDEDLLQAYIDAAVNWVEDYADIVLIEREVKDKVANFRGDLELCREPIKSIESITYLDPDGAEQSIGGFRVYQGNKITPLVGFAWPSKLAKSDIEIKYVAGYGATHEAVPAKIKQALRLLVSHQYEHREAVIVGTISSELPIGVTALIHSVRGESV